LFILKIGNWAEQYIPPFYREIIYASKINFDYSATMDIDCFSQYHLAFQRSHRCGATAEKA